MFSAIVMDMTAPGASRSRLAASRADRGDGLGTQLFRHRGIAQLVRAFTVEAGAPAVHVETRARMR